jgi:hypothetical protein
MITIEEITKQIAPPPIISLSEKVRGQRGDNRVAKSEEWINKSILECFKLQ